MTVPVTPYTSRRGLPSPSDAHDILAGALASAPPLATAFPQGDRLADQLKMVARIISAAPVLGAKRQVFFVAMGGFDTHNGMRDWHPVLMANLAAALGAFYEATTALGVADQVTSFTASEFSRTLISNGDGSEHGWGSTQGRLLQTSSIEQVAATLGSWLGVSDSDLLSMLPNLSNFDAAVRKLGFV